MKGDTNMINQFAWASLLTSLVLITAPAVSAQTAAGSESRNEKPIPQGPTFAPENGASGAKDSPAAKGSTSMRHPYNPQKKPWPIPGTVQAENFDEGTAADPAYYDDSPGSQAPADEYYRKSDVDLGVDALMNLVSTDLI